jgi:hypothetical protein
VHYNTHLVTTAAQPFHNGSGPPSGDEWDRDVFSLAMRLDRITREVAR